MMNDISYNVEPRLSVTEFIDVLNRTTLGVRRPIEDVGRMQTMLDNADVVVCARADGRLVGVARAITDFCYCTYLADLAVDETFQGRAIGRTLIERVHDVAGHQTMLLLIAAPGAETYYPHVGLQPHPSCWTIPRTS